MPAKAERDRPGSHIDDAAPFIPPHQRQHRPRAEERPGDIDPQHLFPFRQRDLLEWTHVQCREDCRVVDEHFGPAEGLFDVGAQPFDRCFIGHVGFDDRRVPVAARDLALDGARLFHIALGDHNFGAGGCKGFGECPPNALAGAGDDDDLVDYGKCFGHGRSPIPMRCRSDRFREHA
jgi:hypothetical protein